MIPLIVTEPELALIEQWVREEADAVVRDAGVDVDYLVGTMIETPRAALVADEIAEVAEFFSFGTNDLTQMTFGFSRDDIEGRFMSEYLEYKLLPHNPFETIDFEGVGQLVRMGVERGRATRESLKLGICGEHGGDPASVAFCHELGLDYVSCSPYRVPIARLAAAHAAMGLGGPGSSAVTTESTVHAMRISCEPIRSTRWTEGDYTVTTDPEVVDLDMVYRFLVDEAYWWQGRSRDVIEHGIANSRPYSLWHDPSGTQVGFGASLTDGGWFAWLGDVMVLREHRGGRGKFLLRCVMEDLAGVRRVVLGTLDAHALYEQVGFGPLERPELMMERLSDEPASLHRRMGCVDWREVVPRRPLPSVRERNRAPDRD